MLARILDSSWFLPSMFALSVLMLALALWLAWQAFAGANNNGRTVVRLLDAVRDKMRAVFARFVAGEVDNALRRMWPLWLLFIACFAVVLFLNPMKAGLAIYGIGKIALAGTVGYLISYCVTARAHRPESLGDGIALGTALKCRTWIICACILAIAIGVP